MPDQNFERQIAEALAQLCGCVDEPLEVPHYPESRSVTVYPGGPRPLYGCPRCRTKRIAAALKAVHDTTWEGDLDVGACLLAGVNALRGEADDA